MSDLESKLLAILAGQKPTTQTGIKDHNVLVYQIKQAFADEGYAYHPWTMLKDGKYYNVDERHEIVARLMTGQEWYKRFQKETKRMFSGKGYASAHNIMGAAKRVAGLSNE
jgi:hypothetical protein